MARQGIHLSKAQLIEGGKRVCARPKTLNSISDFNMSAHVSSSYTYMCSESAICQRILLGATLSLNRDHHGDGNHKASKEMPSI